MKFYFQKKKGNAKLNFCITIVKLQTLALQKEMKQKRDINLLKLDKKQQLTWYDDRHFY